MQGLLDHVAPPGLRTWGGQAEEELVGPCQPIPRHTLGPGVGLVALDWQDQLLAQPCLSPALSPSVPHSRLCSTALMPVVCLPQAGAWGVDAGMDQV